MVKFLKIISGLLVIIFILLLLSPFISLVLPEKLTNHTYFRLFYHVIVDKETKGCITDEEKTLKLFQYVVNHTIMYGNPRKAKPMESLIYGEAYCDFQARILNALLGIAKIKSRYAMLLDKDGISPHTLNEVYLGDKWCVFDTAFIIIFRDEQGNHLSLEELSANPALIAGQKRLLTIKELDPSEYNGIVTAFKRMFPMPASPPRRSIPTMYQEHILDKIADMYFKIFKTRFFNLYQDIYLKIKKRALPADARAFFLARNYHLAYRSNLALKQYQDILNYYPKSTYSEDTVFFCAVLYFEEKQYTQAQDLFIQLREKKSYEWRELANYYLGFIYDFQGKKDAALEVFSQAPLSRLPAEIIIELAKRKEKA